MCSEIDWFSSFLRRNMSGGNNSEFLPVEKEENRETVSRETASEEEKEKGNPGRAADDDDNQKEIEEIKNEEETKDKATVSPRDESEKQISDDDGFKTPTSSDHKIPTTMECPPAPKKTRPQPSKLKRKASPPSGACRSLQFDMLDEVESIFRPMPNQDDNAEEQKIKKARRDNEDRS